jgi:hypothetical protein
LEALFPARSGEIARVTANQGTRGFRAGFVFSEVEGETGMARQRSAKKSSLKRVLARARALAEQVRETAERVQQQAKEAHRLTGIARQQAERGRELSESGRDEARAVVESIKWSINTAGNVKPYRSGEDET